jgi:hypothetical protein
MESTVQTVFRPRSPGNNWAYWKVTRLADLPAATKRHRKTIYFILTSEGLAEHGDATCVYCHNAINEGDDKGNNIYGEYNPRTRRAKLHHYTCGWGALLEDIIIDERANRILVPENIQL